jgi:hypothetical protein
MGELHAPPMVVEELSQYLPVQQIPEWMIVERLEKSQIAESIAWQRAGLLDAGEAESIALAQQLKADWLLTDDAAARLFAVELGLEVHGSLGVVLGAAAFGYLSYAEADRALKRLAKSSLWLSNKIMAEASAALHEMFSK